jgi:HSP20 family protein
VNARKRGSPFVCRVDVFEQGCELIVEAEIPGVDPEEIQVSVESDRISIYARPRKSDTQRRYYRRERSAIGLERVIPLPLTVRREDAEATIRDGVLVVNLGERVELLGTEPRRLRVGRCTATAN